MVLVVATVTVVIVDDRPWHMLLIVKNGKPSLSVFPSHCALWTGENGRTVYIGGLGSEITPFCRTSKFSGYTVSLVGNLDECFNQSRVTLEELLG